MLSKFCMYLGLFGLLFLCQMFLHCTLPFGFPPSPPKPSWSCPSAKKYRGYKVIATQTSPWNYRILVWLTAAEEIWAHVCNRNALPPPGKLFLTWPQLLSLVWPFLARWKALNGKCQSNWSTGYSTYSICLSHKKFNFLQKHYVLKISIETILDSQKYESVNIIYSLPHISHDLSNINFSSKARHRYNLWTWKGYHYQ